MHRAQTRLLAAALVGLCLGMATATAATRSPVAEAAPDFPSGCESDRIQSRLASPDSADVARACGNLRMPWGYRGWYGRQRTMRSYGQRAAGGDWARRLTALLRDAPVDTIYRVPGGELSCDPAAGASVYLVRVHRGDQTTAVLLRFDLGVALLFAAEEPLGMMRLDSVGDSLWALLAETLEDDPVLRRPRPAPSAALLAEPHALGEFVQVDTPPQMMGRGRELPYYPRAAREKGIQGTVFVLAHVVEDGAVDDAVVHAGPVELRDAALETVWGMRFKPARAQGKPVAMWTMVPTAFSLHR